VRARWWALSPMDCQVHLLAPASDHPWGVLKARCGHLLPSGPRQHERSPWGAHRTCPTCAVLARRPTSVPEERWVRNQDTAGPPRCPLPLSEGRQWGRCGGAARWMSCCTCWPPELCSKSRRRATRWRAAASYSSRRTAGVGGPHHRPQHPLAAGGVSGEREASQATVVAASWPWHTAAGESAARVCQRDGRLMAHGGGVGDR